MKKVFLFLNFTENSRSFLLVSPKGKYNLSHHSLARTEFFDSLNAAYFSNSPFGNKYDARRKGGPSTEKSQKKNGFFLLWKVLGEDVSDRNIKVFLIFFCFHLDSSDYQIKTP